MASVTSICNSALAKLGGGRIISIDDTSAEAKLCKEQYSKIKAELLRSHPWNFAIARRTLAQSATTPDFEWSYQYPLPVTCLRVLKVNINNDEPWEKEGNSILTDAGSVSIQYISDVDESLFDPIFAEVLACKLAYDISYSVVQSVSLKEQIGKDYKDKLREARSYDAQEGGVRQVQADEFTNPRF